ncbi:MAG: DNA-processing protein DprA [Planctomycetaceae bacterium]|jgi:DNA processing protein|nr:DNA-processing protein DprA [Planctomycetaceae bacterium]
MTDLFFDELFDESSAPDKTANALDTQKNETAKEQKRYEPEELISEITLNMVNGIGSMLTQRLLNRFGSAEAILSASSSQLQEVEGIGQKIADNISRAKSLYQPEALVNLCRENEIKIIAKNDARYPALLRKISDPPIFLYVKGEFTKSDELAIAIVGTRHASHYGRQQAERLAGEIAQSGFTVVSGLALGIDGAAHRGAIAANGRTIAVLGSGLLNIFPKEHCRLAKEVIQYGAMISEYAPDLQPQKGTFPQRNRIVSGLSLGVLIVEAPRKSGALITATLAGEQGRDIFAVPGQIDRETSRGCHQLIRDGAILVESANDLLEHLGPLVKSAKHPKIKSAKIRHPAELQLNETETKVLQMVETSPTPIDKIIAASGLPTHQVLATLGVLEMRRLIRRSESNTVVRV